MEPTEISIARKEAFEKLVTELGMTEAREGALVTGWVVVIEWMDPDGTAWLEGINAESTAGWKRQGMLFNVLHEWKGTEEQEDD